MFRSEESAFGAAGSPGKAYDLVFWSLLLVFCAFVLSLPLFPTGDGGLHIYYATIFRDLITHSSPLYARFYGVRHLVQPYLLHYYAFGALRTVLSADAAEKVLVLAVLISLATGFRHLVRSLSPAAPGLTLLIFPYLLNWPLGMGALNYDFALGLLFFAVGDFQKLEGPGTRRRLVRFAVVLLLFVLSHPVPLLLLLCIMAVDLLLRWRDLGRGPATFLTRQRSRLLAFGLTCVAFLVPVLIADKAQMANSAAEIYFHSQYVPLLLRSSCLGMFFGQGIFGRFLNRLYFLPFALSLGLLLVSGMAGRVWSRRSTGSDRLMIFAVLLLIASLFAPFWLNGSGFFSLRLWLPSWLLAIAAAAGALKSRWLNWTAAGYGAGLALVSLVMAQLYLRPVAVRSAELERVPLPEGKRGLYVQSRDGTNPGLLHTTYPLFWWNGGRTFIAHNDVMLNSAWLYLTIIPVRENGQAGMLRDYTAREASEDPNVLGFYLSQHPEQRAAALRNADFLFFVDPRPTDPDVQPVIRLTVEPYLQDWNCDLHDVYAICTRKAAGARASAAGTQP